jgi:putative endonuclease
VRDTRFFVYILSNRSRVIYTGLTRDLVRRVHAHRTGLIPGFTQRYRVTRLVYFEETASAIVAIARERQIKSWSRMKKIRLIEKSNLDWRDLAVDWFPKE